jgi:putative restriction endonuclease
MAQIAYGYQHMTYVNCSHRPEIVAALKAIWTPGTGSSLPLGTQGAPKGPQAPEITLSTGWEEGQEVLKTHLKIERSAAAANAAKEAARARGKGVMNCDSCGTAPVETYWVEIIDAHHVVPLGDTKGMARTSTPADFAMLCPTCHRAVHYVLTGGKTEGRDAIEEVRRRALSKR